MKEIKDRPKSKRYGLVEIRYNNKRKTLMLRTIDFYDIERIHKYVEEYYDNNKKIESPEKWILVDDVIRDYFELKTFVKYDLKIRWLKIFNIFRKLNFNAEHSDSLIRQSYWLAFILGGISIIISIIAIEISIILTLR